MANTKRYLTKKVLFFSSTKYHMYLSDLLFQASNYSKHLEQEENAKKFPSGTAFNKRAERVLATYFTNRNESTNTSFFLFWAYRSFFFLLASKKPSSSTSTRDGSSTSVVRIAVSVPSFLSIFFTLRTPLPNRPNLSRSESKVDRFCCRESLSDLMCANKQDKIIPILYSVIKSRRMTSHGLSRTIGRL